MMILLLTEREREREGLQTIVFFCFNAESFQNLVVLVISCIITYNIMYISNDNNVYIYVYIHIIYT